MTNPAVGRDKLVDQFATHSGSLHDDNHLNSYHYDCSDRNEINLNAFRMQKVLKCLYNSCAICLYVERCSSCDKFKAN